MSETLRLAPVRWPDIAMALDFRASARGERVRNGLALRPDRGWLTLALRGPGPGGPPGNLLWSPGLWRGLRNGRGLERLFDIPPLLHPEREEGAGAEEALRALVDWAEATGNGSADAVPAPEPDEIEGWIDPARRQLRAGAALARVEIEAAGSRLALAIPALVRIPPQLPPTRRAWLEELCHDTQRRWRMARLGIDEAGACVRAEVDLSGAPPALARPLVELGLAALTRAAGWALPSLAALADPGLASQLLERRPNGRTSKTHRKIDRNTNRNIHEKENA